MTDRLPAPDLLNGPLRIINIGIEPFAEALRAQDIPVIQVDWRPPAGGNSDMIALLAKLGR